MKRHLVEAKAINGRRPVNIGKIKEMKGEKKMRFELTRYNIDKAIMALRDVIGKNIMIGDTHLIGVDSVEIDEEAVYDGDPVPEENYDGGRTDYIRIIFHIGSGKVIHNFCPDMQVCHFWHELDDLICFSIKKIPDYVKDEKFDLDFRLQEYEKYMSR